MKTNNPESSPEPESVKNLVSQMLPKNGASSDNEIVTRIYMEFRWSLKKLGMTGMPTNADIIALLEAAIKRCRKQIHDLAIKEKAIAKFEESKDLLTGSGSDPAFAPGQQPPPPEDP